MWTVARADLPQLVGDSGPAEVCEAPDARELSHDGKPLSGSIDRVDQICCLLSDSAQVRGGRRSPTSHGPYNPYERCECAATLGARAQAGRLRERFARTLEQL